jgi:hypothetical protein
MHTCLSIAMVYITFQSPHHMKTSVIFVCFEQVPGPIVTSKWSFSWHPLAHPPPPSHPPVVPPHELELNTHCFNVFSRLSQFLLFFLEFLWTRCSLAFAVLMADAFSSISLGKLNICVVFSLFTIRDMEKVPRSHIICKPPLLLVGWPLGALPRSHGHL